MLKYLTISLTAALITPAVVTTASTGQESPVPPVSQPPPVTVASTRFVRPPRAIHHRVWFTPPAAPSTRYVRDVILPYEAARVGASLAHLRTRVNCESTYRWNAQNGQYNGIGQFASSTFWRGVATLGDRMIGWRSTQTRRVPVIRVRTFSDGQVERMPRWRMRQRIITRHVGRLRVVAFDAWTEARIMAEALVGRSAVHDSEWSCR